MHRNRDAQISRYADQIMAEVHGDMETGFSSGKRIPRDVGSFSNLHDYCDANMYLLDVIPGECEPDAYNEMCNAVSDEVDRRLRAEALALNTGERCKCERLVRFNGGQGRGHVTHIDDGSHQCGPCEFCLRCPACSKRLESAGPFDGALPSSGVVDGHAGFGETFACESGHWFAWIQGKMVGPDRILTVLEPLGCTCRARAEHPDVRHAEIDGIVRPCPHHSLIWHDDGKPRVGRRELLSFTADTAVARDGTRFVRVGHDFRICECPTGTGTAFGHAPECPLTTMKG